MDPNRKNFLGGIALGTGLGLLLQLTGYLLLRDDGSAFGIVMFFLVPFVSGVAVSAVVRRPKRILACCVTGTLVTLSIMLCLGWEGIVCCIMASPLVVAGVAIGALVGYRVRGRFIDKLDTPGKATVVLLLVCPLLIAAAERVERPYRSIRQNETFTTAVNLTALPDRVWDLLSQMDKLDGPRPFLLRVGLPVPERCVLESASVGGRRVCYFNSGLIGQEVSHWDKPRLMKFRVTETTLPGRHWLSFIDASYELSAEGDQTKLVRHTTIGTRLHPRWYWRPLERWGVTSEHEFVLSNLKRWTQSRE